MIEPPCIVCGAATSVSVGGTPCCITHQNAAERWGSALAAADELAAHFGTDAALRWPALRAALVRHLMPPQKRLHDLASFNVARSKSYRRDHGPAPRPNGIACPTCSGELVDSHPGITLTSNPPQVNVACPACGFTGYRVA